MLNLKYRLNNLYKYVRYGTRTTTVSFVSTIVECQDVYTMDTYDCAECPMMALCYEDEKKRFVDYLKRGNRYQ